MNKEVNSELIKKKLSGKYSPYLIIYEKLRDSLFSQFDDLTIIPKTIYLIIDSPKGILAVLFWKNDGLHLALETPKEDPLLYPALDLKYPPLNKKFILKTEDDINEFLIKTISEIYTSL